MEDDNKLPDLSGERKVGRPSSYNEEKAKELLDLITTTTFGLRKICEELDLNMGTVMRWLAANSEFRDQYARAKEMQQELVAEEMLEIIDRTVEKNDMAAAQMNKLAFEGRKWIMGKLSPKVYGDKIQVDAPPPAKNLSEEQFESLKKMIAEKQKRKEDENGQYEDATVVSD